MWKGKVMRSRGAVARAHADAAAGARRARGRRLCGRRWEISRARAWSPPRNESRGSAKRCLGCVLPEGGERDGTPRAGGPCHPPTGGSAGRRAGAAAGRAVVAASTARASAGGVGRRGPISRRVAGGRGRPRATSLRRSAERCGSGTRVGARSWIGKVGGARRATGWRSTTTIRSGAAARPGSRTSGSSVDRTTRLWSGGRVEGRAPLSGGAGIDGAEVALGV